MCGGNLPALVLLGHHVCLEGCHLGVPQWPRPLAKSTIRISPGYMVLLRQTKGLAPTLNHRLHCPKTEQAVRQLWGMQLPGTPPPSYCFQPFQPALSNHLGMVTGRRNPGAGTFVDWAVALAVPQTVLIPCNVCPVSLERNTGKNLHM